MQVHQRRGEIRREVEAKTRNQKNLFQGTKIVQRRQRNKTLGGCALMAISWKGKCFEVEVCMYLDNFIYSALVS